MKPLAGYLLTLPVLNGSYNQIYQTLNMKKFLSFLAAATFVVALSSCGGSSEEAATTEATEVATEATTEATTEAAAVVDSAAAVVDTAAAAVAQ